MNFSSNRFLTTIALLLALLCCLASCTDNGATIGESTADNTTAEEPTETTDETTTDESSVGEETTTEADDTTAEDGTTESEKTDPPAPDPDPASLIDSFEEFSLEMTEIWKMSPFTDKNGVKCHVVQGGCTDGTYIYVASNDGQSKNDQSISVVRKYHIETQKLVAVYENLKISHCNDMTYNPETKEILMVHNSPDRQHVSIYDAETMTFKEMITLHLEIYSMSYDPYEQCYWVGISNCYNFAKLDFSFKQIGDIYEGYASGYTKQGMDIDSKYIYFLQYKSNCIMVYNKAGQFVRQIDLPKTAYEPENICHIGSTFYVGYYQGSTAGGMMYRTEIVEKKPDPVKVTMQQLTTLPSYTDASGNAFTMAQGMCTDGKYLFVAMNNSNIRQSIIYKLDPKTGSVLTTYENISADLTNDLVYNPKTKQIIAVHNGNSATQISIYDAETLAFVKTVTLDRKIYAMTYSASEDCYYIGISGGYTYARYDSSFKQIGSVISGPNLGNTKQGMDCDGEHFYMIMSKSNSLGVYTLDGTHIALITLPASADAAQDLCHIGDTYYIIYAGTNGGGVLYTATITYI